MSDICLGLAQWKRDIIGGPPACKTFFRLSLLYYCYNLHHVYQPAVIHSFA